MHRQRIDCLFVNLDGLEEHKRVGIVDGDGAFGVGGEEVAGEGGERWRREQGEGGDRGGVVEGSYLRRGGKVVDFDAVVVAAGDGDGTGNGDGFDGGEVGGEGEEWR